MAETHTTRGMSGPIDREQLAALRVIRRAFGDVQVVSVEDNPPEVIDPEQLQLGGDAA